MPETPRGGATIPIEAITGPRALLEYEEWKREVEFLDEFKTFALGANEKGAITDAEIKLLSKWFLIPSQFSFIMWELFGIPLEYIIGSKRPTYIGTKNAQDFIDKVYEICGLKDKRPMIDEMEFGRYVRELKEKKEKKEEEPTIPLRDYLAIVRELGVDPFEDVEIKGEKVKIGGINRERLEEGLRNLREREEEERVRREAQRARHGYGGVPWYFGSLPSAEEIKEVMEYLDNVAQEKGEEYAEKLKDIVTELYKAYSVLVYAKSGEALGKAMRKYAEIFEAVYENYQRGG